jgi:signal transduction histidine kinase
VPAKHENLEFLFDKIANIMAILEHQVAVIVTGFFRPCWFATKTYMYIVSLACISFTHLHLLYQFDIELKAFEQIDSAFVLCMQSEGFCEQSIAASSTFQRLCRLQYNCCVVVVGGVVIDLISGVKCAKSSVWLKLARSIGVLEFGS